MNRASSRGWWSLPLTLALLVTVSAGADDAGFESLDAGTLAESPDGGEPVFDGGVALGLGLEFDALAADADPADGGGTAVDAGAQLQVDRDEVPLVVEVHDGPSDQADAPDGSDFVKSFLGIIALLVLAWIGGQDWLKRLEEKAGVSQVVTSGFPFVLLGLVAHAPGIDVLSDDVVTDLRPLLAFGLGWIGFHTGFQLDSRALDATPRGTASALVLLTVLPFATITLAVAGILWAFAPEVEFRVLATNALILGIAGALSAPTAARLAGMRTQAALDLLRAIGVLDDALGVLLFACLGAYLLPASTGGWELPGVGWIFVTFGIAATLGLLTFAVLRGTESTAEKTSHLLGAVCLTTGMAGVFGIAPLVVCFLAGVLLRNLPGDDKAQLEESFGRLERPIYHVFLVFVGALSRPDRIEGWVILVVFVAMRAAGRYLGVAALRRLAPEQQPEALRQTARSDLVLPPMGQLAIAFVVMAQHRDASTLSKSLITAVIVGGIVNEIGVQIAARRRLPPPEAGA